MTKNKNPAAGCTASGAGNALAVDRSDSRLKSPTTKANSYWIAGRTEFWRIPNTGGINEDGDIVDLFPPGKGWFAPIADRHDGFTLWQRKVRR
jgi:hypothetical protein